MSFNLASGPTPETLAGVDALVHAAYDFSCTRWTDVARVNVDGSRRLLAAARRAEVDRIVYVSTVAAFPGARSMYGRAKLEIERMAMGLGATIVRCGLVWGPRGGAMFGALRHAVERLPVVPLVAPANLPVMLVCEDDLVELGEVVTDELPVEVDPDLLLLPVYAPDPAYVTVVDVLIVVVPDLHDLIARLEYPASPLELVR